MTDVNPIATLFDSFRPRRVRTFRQFAEQEIVMPRGPRKGLKFRCDFMPWTGLVLDEFTRGYYRRFFGAGPVQGGKTFIFFVIPVLYHLFEMKEDVILGVPNIDLAQGIFHDRLLPVIEMTKYAGLLPTKGAGSRGGKFTTIKFLNGAMLRFMGAGGGDEQRSSHNARIVVLTEIDKMDVQKKVSREADPVTQIEARSRAFGVRARTYAECTMSVEHGRVNQEITVHGTDTKVFVACQYCGVYAMAERENFIGHQDAEDVLAAREQAGYTCPSCGVVWSEENKIMALRAPRLVAKGQTVDDDSRAVEGDPPRTNTFGFRWNSMHSAMTTIADIAEVEYRAKKSGTDEDLRAVYQFTWALPYEGRVFDSSEVSVGLVMEHKKYSDYMSGGKEPMPFVYQPGRTCVTAGVDVHKRFLVMVVDAWEVDVDSCVTRSWRLDYKVFVCVDNPDSIFTALEQVRNYLADGWLDANGVRFKMNAAGVDSGWQDTKKQKVRVVAGGDYQVYRFVRTHGQGTWRATKGEAGLVEGIVNRVLQERERVWLWHIDTDLAKCEIHDMLRVGIDKPGFWHVPQDVPREYARGIASERRVVDFDKNNREKVKWVIVDPYNHPLDATVGSWATARALGVRPPRGKFTEEKK